MLEEKENLLDYLKLTSNHDNLKKLIRPLNKNDRINAANLREIIDKLKNKEKD